MEKSLSELVTIMGEAINQKLHILISKILLVIISFFLIVMIGFISLVIIIWPQTQQNQIKQEKVYIVSTEYVNNLNNSKYLFQTKRRGKQICKYYRNSTITQSEYYTICKSVE